MIILCICLLENFACSGIQKNQLCVPKLFKSLCYIFWLLKTNNNNKKPNQKRKETKQNKKDTGHDDRVKCSCQNNFLSLLD